jgi:hypothetical protein
LRTDKVEETAPAEPFDQQRANAAGDHRAKVRTGQTNAKHSALVDGSQMPGDDAGHGREVESWNKQRTVKLNTVKLFIYPVQRQSGFGPAEEQTEANLTSRQSRKAVA